MEFGILVKPVAFDLTRIMRSDVEDKVMDKKSMVLLIETFDAICKLDDYLSVVSGHCGLGDSPFADVYKLSEAIYRNSKLYGSNDDDAGEKCLDILNDRELSAEKRCSLLLA